MEVSGTAGTVGSTSPGVVTEVTAFDDVAKMLVESCLAAMVPEVEEPVVVIVVLDGSRVIVDPGTVFGLLEGNATGQNDHTMRVASQYISRTSLRNPTARRLERQSPNSSSAYRRWLKHAADRETPGAVTKLMGTCAPMSL